MRVILALTGAVVALALSGCDINTSGQKQANCNCATTPPAAPPVAVTPPDTRGSTAYMPSDEDVDTGGHRYRHRTYGSGGHHRPRGYAYNGGHHGYYWRREYSEISVATYDYHSGSSSSYFGYTGGGSYHGGGEYHGHGEHGDDGYRPVDGGWIDGYGRGHGGHTGDAVHYETGGDDGRDHVWHGYDADCPDDPHHGHH